MTFTQTRPLTSAEATTLDRYWRAANYLSAGQIYLMANPLLAEPLRPEHIKPRQQMADTRARHRAWTREHGEDLPEVRDWSWPRD